MDNHTLKALIVENLSNGGGTIWVKSPIYLTGNSFFESLQKEFKDEADLVLYEGHLISVEPHSKKKPTLTITDDENTITIKPCISSDVLPSHALSREQAIQHRAKRYARPIRHISRILNHKITVTKEKKFRATLGHTPTPLAQKILKEHFKHLGVLSFVNVPEDHPHPDEVFMDFEMSEEIF